jgi:hypothetical protein
MNQLPVNKILIAGFAFAMTHWKKILEISIIPLLLSLPLFTLLPELKIIMEQIFLALKEATPESPLPEVILPNNLAIYLTLFVYGSASLSINMYRLVILGKKSVGVAPVFNITQMLRFIGLKLVIGLVNILPLFLTSLLMLQFVASFLIVPVMLNLVNIAIVAPSKYRWKLSFFTQINLLLLQVILPILAILLFNFLLHYTGFSGVYTGLAVQVAVFYWSAITLALCYQIITNPKQKP